MDGLKGRRGDGSARSRNSMPTVFEAVGGEGFGERGLTELVHSEGEEQQVSLTGVFAPGWALGRGGMEKVDGGECARLNAMEGLE